MKFITILISLIAFAGFNCADKKYSDIEKVKIMQGILVMAASGSSGTAVSCTTSVTYSSLGTSGLTSKCASCHGPGNKSAGYDVTSYAEASKAISSGNPDSSKLYTKVNGGSMASYSDTALNNAIYCWIKAGAPQ